MINWQNIKKGALGFENLAMEYVDDIFNSPSGKWTPTKETRDGNKDGYTIIIGYHPGVDTDETWWMEAKYSTSTRTKYLTRYRIDATIVSSILHKNVSKIVFVTNIDIHSKTISDIRFSLQKAIGCEDVFFCTKASLEYWLIQNPSIYKKYFDPPTCLLNSNFSIFISEEIKIYPYCNYQRSYIEDCKYIYPNQKYLAYFKIVSPTNQIVDICPSQKGIKLDAKQINLCIGENCIEIGVEFSKSFNPITIKKDGSQFCKLDLIVINKSLKVMLHHQINILEDTDIKLKISSQSEVYKELSVKLKHFIKKRETAFFLIHGESGTGKTYIAQHILQEKILKNENVFYCSFTQDQLENCRMLLQMVCFLIYPYISFDEIDSAYLKKINETINVSSSFIQLISHKKNLKILEKSMHAHCESHNKLLPEELIFSGKFFFLDNIHKLNEASGNFLCSLIQEIQEKNCSCFFSFLGQSHCLETHLIQKIRQRHSLIVKECYVDNQDILNNFQAILGYVFDFPIHVLNEYFPNLIILIEFIKFLHLSTTFPIASADDFLICYYNFVNGGLGEDLILAQFSNVNFSPETQKLFALIYTSANGIPIDDNNPSTNYLLQTGLVKIDDKNQLVPFHDIYTEIYRKSYKISKQALGIPYVDDFDKARETILFSTSIENIEKVVDYISQIRKEGKYRSVCYILDSFFQNPKATSVNLLLKSNHNKELYYQMYFDYAYATINCSRNHTGYDYFEKIYKEISGINSTKMRHIKLELLFELMNSNYNISKYSEAMQNYCQFQILLTLMIHSGQLQQNRINYYPYVLCENMRILIQSSRGKRASEKMFLKWREVLKENGYIDYFIDFNLRYAHTLYVIDMERALLYTKEAYKYLPDNIVIRSKLWYLATFQYLYVQMIYKEDFSQLDKIEKLVDESQKEFYSNFRHRNLAICCIFYMLGDVDKADERFFKDMAQPRRLRNRLKGFYFETLALHYLLHKDIKNAMLALKSAAELFRTNASYLRPILHNQKVLINNMFSCKRMGLYKGGYLEPNRYYIDPRVD